MTEERYALAIGRIREMAEEQTVEDARFRDYFRRMADFVMMTDELRTALSDGSYEAMEIEELKEWNRRLYADILPGKYETSYANPAFAVRELSEEYGGLLSFLYAELRGIIVYAFEKKTAYMDILMELLIEVYNQFEEGIP